jgi:hypothetical protein
MNEIELKRGAERLRKPEVIGLILICSFIIALMIAAWGITAGLVFMIVPLSVFFVSVIFYNPRNGLVAVYTLNFFALGIYRYINVIPWGLTVDILLVLTYLGLFFHTFHRKVEWGNARNELTLIALIWFGYSLMELVNPEAGSRAAWFYAVRGISLYMLLTIPLIFIIFNKRSDLRLFLLLWGIFSVLGTLKGIQQKYIGVDPFEQRWLDEGGAAQHLLFGELRVFSFFSDAGQFGAAQGMAGVVFGMLALGEKSFRRRIFYAVVAILGLYGMMISGTRGAISVPFAGLILYIILRKNNKILIIGAAVLIVVFVFFKYTYIGQNNGTIRRMRTAFNPEDASLQTRLINQQRIKGYLSSRPFGGGLGATGALGQKYNPGSFLSTVPTDSWYVMIWMEKGIVGLILHLSLLFYILGKISYLVMFRIKNTSVKTETIALASGMFGVMAASYGNPVLGQMPVGIILYSSMAFMYLAPKFDLEETISLENKCLIKGIAHEN